MSAALIAIAAFVFFALKGWPGAPSRCLRDFVCYCERVRRVGFVRQPWNTWSSLGCLPIAAWVASDAAGIRMGRVPDDERRRAAAELGLLFAFAIACEGLGSLYFHGSLTSWGAVLDSVGISAIGGVVLLSALLRGGVVKRRGVRWGLPGVVAAALAYRLFVLPVMAPFFLLLLVGIALGERRAIRSKAGVSTGPWFSRALAVFGLGVVVLLLSALPGFPLCRGDFVQAHALWHLLSAGASWCCWMHARSELILEGQPF